MVREISHKALTVALVFAVSIAWCGLFAQAGTAVHQVQAVIGGLRTPQQALHVDQMIHGIDGVLVSRTDMQTSNLFLLVRADAQVDPGSVRALLAPSGLTLSCWMRGPRGDAPFKALDPGECEPGPATK